jgi:integrase
MKAWLFQDNRQKAKLGDKCPWSVGWFDPAGRKRSKKIGSKSMAEKYARKKEGELAAGLCRSGPERVSWAAFRAEYERTIMPKWRSEWSRIDAAHALNAFEEVARPKYVGLITERTLDQYVAARLPMRGKRKGDTVSPETIRKELRAIRAALNQAKRWKYLAAVPATPEVKGFGRDKPYVTEEHCNLILGACDTARLPADQHFTPGDFWRALLGMAWVTGMRKSALLAMEWADVDIEEGIAISRARSNKQKRDQRHKIGPVVGLLKTLYAVRKPGEVRVFAWNYSAPSLYRQLAAIEEAAGIYLLCGENHEHTQWCHLYGFHSFRYAHATYNFGRVPDRDLQEQMGHRSFTTTERYIKYAKEHQQRAYDVFLPKALKGVAG